MLKVNETLNVLVHVVPRSSYYAVVSSLGICIMSALIYSKYNGVAIWATAWYSHVQLTGKLDDLISLIVPQ